MSNITEGYLINIGEGEIFYRFTEGKPWIVYLHGFVGNMTGLKKQREYFTRKGFGELAIDLRGNGKSFKSKKEEDYKLERFTDDLLKALKELKIEKFHLLRHSMGTMVAQAFAVKYPQKVTSLILIGSFFSLTQALGWKSKLLSLFKLPVKATTGLLDLISESSRESTYYPDFSRDYGKNAEWKKLFQDIYNQVRAFGSSPLVQGCALLSWNTKDVAHQIKVPTLLIHGSSDDIIPVEMAYKLKNLIPGSNLVILDGAHMVQASNPRKVNQAIEDFIYSPK